MPQEQSPTLSRWLPGLGAVSIHLPSEATGQDKLTEAAVLFQGSEKPWAFQVFLHVFPLGCL